MTTQDILTCDQCSGELKYAPGVEALECPYCGHVNEVEVDPEEVIEELDFTEALRTAESSQEMREAVVVRCDGCGAQVELGANVTARDCCYCGDSLEAHEKSERRFKPRSLLPFAVTDDQARELFRKWILSLWFAPNALKKLARVQDGLKGVYVPYWTYDCYALTDYRGQRGEHYWVTQTYTVMVDGKPQTRTKQVRKTRWYPASGRVSNSFDDVLVLASGSLPRKISRKLEPWDLHELKSFREEYLSGFVTEAYQTSLEDGFGVAKGRMSPTIDQTIRRDIGGDEQRIHHRTTDYQDITFKHILLPLWLSAYRYREKVYRFFVNARTGEVQGERPWSWAKIVLLVLTIIAVGGGIAAAVNLSQ